jgi:multidrug efflux pump subunit AcrA (membrane-fusion protein)
VKTIQPLENSVVSEILVKDGDVVKAFDVLVVLDTRQTSSDVKNLESQQAEKVSRLVFFLTLDPLLTDQASEHPLPSRFNDDIQTLTSPIDGVVQALTVFTVGGVVTEAEKIMQIVPTSGGLEIEAYISNKDIRFVQKNQDVVIKVDSFNFTKYGTIEGTVADISNGAFQDEKLGLIFKCKISMKTEQIMIDGKHINLGSGMTVSAEIVTGDRRQENH